MKEKMPMYLGVIIFIVLCGVAFYFTFEKDYTYYTQIDNSKITEIENGDMKYEYKLKMYEEKGSSKEIKFKTVRVLREGAFLKVKYYLISGVNKWEEVEYEELPSKVKEHYEKP